MKKYTEKEIEYNYYNNYKHNLLNIANLFDYKFIPIKDIKISTDITQNWNDWTADLFLLNISKDKIKLAQSISKIGTYWPLWVIQYDNEYHIYEGRHRINSLQLAISEGIIEEDFELLSLIAPLGLFYMFDIEYFNYDIKPILLYYNKDFTKLKTITKIKDAFFSVLQYPRFLRNYLYKYPNIKPLPLINNKQLWYESINSNR